MTRRNPLLTLAAISAAALSLALAACGRNNEGESPTIGQSVDSTVATTEQGAAEIRDDVRSGAQTAGDQAREAAHAAGSAVRDAAITSAVNAELARDPALSALRINVDTQDGRVQLKGAAPDADARARATTLAYGVKGVVTVDNQLDVTPSS